MIMFTFVSISLISSIVKDLDVGPVIAVLTSGVTSGGGRRTSRWRRLQLNSN
jgi:hypothetical protein